MSLIKDTRVSKVDGFVGLTMFSRSKCFAKIVARFIMLLINESFLIRRVEYKTYNLFISKSLTAKLFFTLKKFSSTFNCPSKIYPSID